MTGRDADRNNKSNYLRTSGTYKIAGVLMDLGWTVDVLDYITMWSESDLRAYLTRALRADTRILGVSHTLLPSARAKHLLGLARELAPDALLIAGGQTPFDTDLGADYYITGYGEAAVEALIRHLFHDGPPIKSTPLHAGRELNSYHHYPAWPRPSYAARYQPSDFLNKHDVPLIELSRGCRFACKFCNFPLIGMKEDSSVDEELLYRELNELHQTYGISNFALSDDTVNDRTSKLEKLVRVVRRLGFKATFESYVRIDLLHTWPEQLPMMAEAGIINHVYGVETLNHETAKIIGKGLHPDKIKETLLTVSEYIRHHAGFYNGSIGMIVGLPREDLASIERSHHWLMENWIARGYHVNWFPLQIVPNGVSRLSAFGLDMERYGYRIMAGHDRHEPADFNPDRIPSPLAIKHAVVWENDLMDVFQARETVDRLWDQSMGSGRLDPWSSQYSMSFLGDTGGPWWERIINPLLAKHVSDYINNKLRSVGADR